MYLIAGYPRSRTAWLANFLTWERSFCFHEATRFGTSAREVLKLMQEKAPRGTKYIGNSDSVMGLYAQGLLHARRDFPFKLVTVYRDPNDVVESIVAARMMPRPAARNVVERLKPGLRLLEAHADLNLNLEELEDPGTCRQLWNSVAPGHEMPKERIWEAQMLNVQAPVQWRVESASPESIRWVSEMLTAEQEEA
jgi:hypothetical protein